MWVERLQSTAQTSKAIILPIHFTSIFFFFFFSFPECYFVTPLAHCCACCGECKKGRNFANSSRRHSRCSEWSHSLVRLDVARVQVLCQVGLFHFAREAGEEAGCCRRAVYTRRQLSGNKQAVAGQRSRRSRSVYAHVYTRARANLYLLVFEERRRPSDRSSCSGDAQQAAWVCFQEWEENNWLAVRGWKQMKERLTVIFPDETYTVSYSPCNSSRLCYRQW